MTVERDIIANVAWVLAGVLERQLYRTRRDQSLACCGQGRTRAWSEGGERELNRGTWANQVGVHVVALWACTFT